MFSGMDEHQFATFFIVAKQEQIKQELNIDNLYLNNAITIIHEFILNNKDNILLRFQTQYDSLFDEDFFIFFITLLKNAKKRGIPLKIDMK